MSHAELYKAREALKLADAEKVRLRIALQKITEVGDDPGDMDADDALAVITGIANDALDQES
jgi:hypothetical protein